MKLVWLNILWVVPGVLVLIAAHSAPPSRVIEIPLASDSSPEHTIICDEKRPQKVKIALGRITVINFPFKPKEVVPGGMSFDFKKIKNDLVIKAMRPQGSTNLLVYLEDRRCSFDLVTVTHGGDDILVVRDTKDVQMEPNFHE